MSDEAATPDGFLELSDAIGAVRQQLVEAQLAGRKVVAGRVLTFKVGKVNVEFTGELKNVAGGGAGVKFWVVSADAKLEHTRGAGHKLTVELIPQGPDGEGFLVTDQADAPPPE